MQETVTVKTLKEMIAGLSGQSIFYGLTDEHNNDSIRVRFCSKRKSHKTALKAKKINQNILMILWYDAEKEEFQVSFSCFSRIFFVIPTILIKSHLKEKLRQLILAGKVRTVH